MHFYSLFHMVRNRIIITITIHMACMEGLHTVILKARRLKGNDENIYFSLIIHQQM